MARLAFLGTPEAAVPPLRALVSAGHDIAVVVTQPDRRRGRGATLSPSPVKAAAQALGLTVTHKVDDVLGKQVELGVVVAFGRLIRPHVLAEVSMVNVHFSLLPRWRGAAPVERAILAGDTETGVCLMALEEGLDTGPVYECVPVAVGEEDTAQELRDRLVAVGTQLVVSRLAEGPSSLGQPVAQSGEPTYAAKIEAEELELDWAGPVMQAHRLIRLGSAWTTFRGQRFHVLRARRPGSGVESATGPVAPAEPGPAGCVRRHHGEVWVAAGDGWLELVEVKPSGKGAMGAAAWFNGARPGPDERFGQ